jgi:hypothetical protein
MALMLWLMALTVQGSAAKAPPPPDPSLIRVYVETSPVGEGAELSGRSASVKDLAEEVARKKKSLASVTDEDLADVVVEVVQRAIDVPRVVIGVGARPGEPPGGTTPLRTGKLRVALRFGAMQVSLESKNKAYDNPRGWKSAAEDLADQIDKWVGQYRTEIIKARR